MEIQENGMCTLCGFCNSADEHTREVHSFNFLLFEYNNYRKALAKNRNGIEITQSIEEDVPIEHQEYNMSNGTFTVKVSREKLQSLNNSINFKFTIKNARETGNIFLVLCTFVYPLGPYNVDDEEGVVKSKMYLRLKPRETYLINVSFNPSQLNIGQYSNHLAFKFQDSESKQYTFFRNLLVCVQDHEDTEEADSATHFKGEAWSIKDLKIIEATNKQICRDEYPIPEAYMVAILSGLRFLPEFSFKDRDTIKFLLNTLGHRNNQTGEFITHLTFENYGLFFHILLWLDEACQTLSLLQYNMSDVTLTVAIPGVLELEVEGLAEKRPSLLPGDLIYIRLHNDHTAYEGVIKTVNDRTIWISSIHSDLLDIVEMNDKTEFDVSFKLSRLTYERKHKAVDMCVRKALSSTLFPLPQLLQRNVVPRYKAENLSFFNQNVYANGEQRAAVLAILNETSFPAPYIVFGPPGTGKTVTIVEAILQIKKHKPKAKILICAPSNAACDMLTIKLTEHGRCNKKELIRIHAESRNWSDVPLSVRPFSNHDGIHFTRLEFYQIQQYKIIITTLVLIGKFSGHYIPDYVFIDEAAQAPEPEADIAISMVTTPRIILAGDPKQLGPVCQSKVAERKGLGLSILERLMNTELYKHFDSRFISMLRLNYRAHPSVLHVPNQLFYEGQLLAINKSAENDPIANLCVASLLRKKNKKITKGFPVEFYSVIAHEQRKGKSPSYFNPMEVDVVVKHVIALLQQNHVSVKQEDIGIIAPYIRQVHQLKGELRKHNYSDVEVGTTEAYQGREKRILIISTVRGKTNHLLYDRKYDLGFVQNEKRMNVALTRAMSKLIIVGNPMVLNANTESCKNWRYLIEFCQQNNSVFGTPYKRRDCEVQKEIRRRINEVNQN